MHVGIYTPSQAQMTDGNKCLTLTDCKQINRLTFLMMDLLSYLSNYPPFIIPQCS